METFLLILRFFVWCSIVFAIIEVYLKINKLWKRKHERVVAESQSIMAETLSIVSALPLLLLYALEEQYEGVAELVVWIPVNILVILIGAGLWVHTSSRRGIWQLILSSVRAERREVGDLAKSFFKPAGSEIIMEILSRIAMIDNNLDDREKAFIETFARTWGIPFVIDEQRRSLSDEQNRFVALRDSVSQYLDISPPREQATQLRDTIKVLVSIDDAVTSEETLVTSEINAMLAHYIECDAARTMYEVYIAPQSKEQEHTVRRLLHDAESKHSAGGVVYLVDVFYSEDFADIVCNKYREYDLLTFVNKNTVTAGGVAK
ncbi:MAG: hypothetical protein LC116_07495 [Bacteroidetes bacterium]|nr:hypothetical protein [Bacteroidota bacterium]MCZ2133010.1 hypothetical protein [Bacteroidota bacterium]